MSVGEGRGSWNKTMFCVIVLIKLPDKLKSNVLLSMYLVDILIDK